MLILIYSSSSSSKRYYYHRVLQVDYRTAAVHLTAAAAALSLTALLSLPPKSSTTSRSPFSHSCLCVSLCVYIYMCVNAGDLTNMPECGGRTLQQCRLKYKHLTHTSAFSSTNALLLSFSFIYLHFNTLILTVQFKISCSSL